MVKAARHSYSVVACKTRGCDAVCALQYLGNASDATRNLPQAFSFQCNVCGRIHRYSVGDTGVEDYGFDPPEDWVGPVLTDWYPLGKWPIL